MSRSPTNSGGRRSGVARKGRFLQGLTKLDKTTTDLTTIMEHSMRKILLAMALCLALCACTGPQAKTTTDLATIIGEAAYASAEIYYQQNQANFSPQDAILFEHYLSGFRLALDQGQCVQAMVDQWRQFYNAPIYLDECQEDTPKQ